MVARGVRLTAVVALVAAIAVLAPATPAHAKGPTVEQKIAAAQKAANASAAKLNQAINESNKAKADVERFRAQSASNRAKLNALQTNLRGYAISEYQSGGGASYVFVDDPATLARTHYLQRTVALGSIDELDAYRVLLEDESITQRALEARMRDRENAVAKQRAQRAALMAQLTSLGKAMKAQKSGLRVLAKGPWVCPVQGPRAFSNDWGQPRSGGRRHKGTDILSPSGTPVVAPVAGSVVDHDSGLGGKGFFLHGVDGNTYYGAHLSRFGATGRVAQGQVVGYVGTSGNARGGPAHLHFEIHPGNGAAVNPYGTLRTYC